MKFFSTIFLFIFTTCLFGQTSKKDFKKEICDYRKEYKAKFLEKPQSPLNKKDLKQLRFFKPNQAFQVEAKVALTPESEPFEMATYSGQKQVYRKYADLEFELEGKKHQLSIYQNLLLLRIPDYKEYLFLPFKDLTNGNTTYGGGRYLDFKIYNIKDSILTIDFNKSYNPWCHYKDGYSCPIPPRGNHLNLEIFAGEKNFGIKDK